MQGMQQLWNLLILRLNLGFRFYEAEPSVCLHRPLPAIETVSGPKGEKRRQAPQKALRTIFLPSVIQLYPLCAQNASKKFGIFCRNVNVRHRAAALAAAVCCLRHICGAICFCAILHAVYGVYYVKVA